MTIRRKPVMYAGLPSSSQDSSSETASVFIGTDTTRDLDDSFNLDDYEGPPAYEDSSESKTYTRDDTKPLMSDHDAYPGSYVVNSHDEFNAYGSRPKYVISSTGRTLTAAQARVCLDAGTLSEADLDHFDPRIHAGCSPDGYCEPIHGIACAVGHTVKEVLGGVTALPRAAFAGSFRGENSTGLEKTKAVGKEFAFGIGRTVRAGLCAPRDYTTALAKGFGNVPRAYGDQTVRRTIEVDGIGSGAVAAGKGLACGLYDGLTGFVMHPVNGVKDGGAIGFAKGLGKGIGGLVCKPCAGAIGVPASLLQGVHAEMQNACRFETLNTGTVAV